MKKDIIKTLKQSINDIHYQKYLRILVEINKYRMYTKSDINLNMIMDYVKVPLKLRSLVMTGSPSVSLTLYDEIIKAIQIAQKNAMSILSLSSAVTYKRPYIDSASSNTPVKNNKLISECYDLFNVKDKFNYSDNSLISF